MGHVVDQHRHVTGFQVLLGHVARDRDFLIELQSHCITCAYHHDLVIVYLPTARPARGGAPRACALVCQLRSGGPTRFNVFSMSGVGFNRCLAARCGAGRTAPIVCAE
jgi:hypothetical protein